MSGFERQADADLLLGGSAEAFGAFYRRHLPWVLRWLHGHVRDRELAADLAGEVFASALRSRGRYDRDRGGAEAWLQAIARNVLIDSLRRGRVEDRARRELGIQPIPLTEDDLARVDELIDQARGEAPATAALDRLPPGQVEVIRAHVIDDEEYSDIARRLECSPSVVRQRVSRGLRAMRAAMEEER
jgi:RNA polymerase sigma-70 factor (ECF subfamily)